VAQVVGHLPSQAQGPEFKPQYHKKKEEQWPKIQGIFKLEKILPLRLEKGEMHMHVYGVGLVFELRTSHLLGRHSTT
jgi:hypothetical protein